VQGAGAREFKGGALGWAAIGWRLCIHARMHAHPRAHTHTQTHTHAHARMHTCIHAHPPTQAQTHTHTHTSTPILHRQLRRAPYCGGLTAAGQGGRGCCSLCGSSKMRCVRGMSCAHGVLGDVRSCAWSCWVCEAVPPLPAGHNPPVLRLQRAAQPCTACLLATRGCLVLPVEGWGCCMRQQRLHTRQRARAMVRSPKAVPRCATAPVSHLLSAVFFISCTARLLALGPLRCCAGGGDAVGGSSPHFRR